MSLISFRKEKSWDMCLCRIECDYLVAIKKLKPLSTEAQRTWRKSQGIKVTMLSPFFRFHIERFIAADSRLAE